jgi:DNA polymerase III epsilon subunit family exonuclease
MDLATPLNLVTFVSVDVETTGLDPWRDQIVEIGAVKVRGGAVVEEFATLVRVDRTIPLAARRVHGISNDMLVGKPPVAEALSLFLRFAGDGALVEHSHEAFDVLFLETAHGSPLTAPYINTCALSRRLFPFIPRHSLEECCRRMNITNRSPHRALGDARATAELLICLLATCAPRYPRLQDLVSAASVRRPPGEADARPSRPPSGRWQRRTRRRP